MSFKSRFKQFMRKTNESPMNNRKKVGIILFATSIGLFFLFAIRFSYVVVKGEVAGVSLEEKTKELYEGSKVVKARRGTIYDRNGEIIATDAVSYTVKAVLSETYVSGKDKLYAQEKDFASIAKVLKENLNLDESYVMEQLQNGMKNNAWEVLFGKEGKDISIETKKKIEAQLEELDIAGIYFDGKTTRMYPNGTLASHFIGYAEDTGTGLNGVMGLEGAYDDILSGQDGKITYKQDNYQNPLPGTVEDEVKAVDGKDIYTTIDIKTQTRLETAMAEAYSSNEPVNMTAMIVEAKTGNIVAMTQEPTFNPDTKDGLDSKDMIWQNLLVQDSFEPGSTMKSMTVAAAIENGVFNENETYTAYNGYTVGDTTINDWDFGNAGPLTMRQALTWSSNVGMLHLEERMKEGWQLYLKKFGFGKSTNSGLTEETTGWLPDDNIVNQAMSSFGQAIAVSNFQMIQAYTAIANNGVMLKPQYISKVVNPDTGETNVVQPEVVGNPISSNTAALIREYLKGTVEDPNYGVAYDKYSVEGYPISVKTGTAQVAKEKASGYVTDNYLYSMIEMVPSDDPEYIIYLTIKLPENYNADVLATVANPLMKFVMDFQETETAEQEAVEDSPVTVGNYTDKDTSSAAPQARKDLLNPVVVGDGSKIVAQSLEPETQTATSSRILLITDGEKIMPDVYDWTKEELESLEKLYEVSIEIEGEGKAVSQSVSSYTAIGDQTITVQLQ